MLTEAQWEIFKRKMLPAEPLSRSWTLVGFYMQQFAMLEAEIDLTMESVMGVPALSVFVFGRNMEISAKLKALRTTVDIMFSVMRPQNADQAQVVREARAAADNALKLIQKPHIEDRNVVAHAQFMPVETGGGVVFRTVRANANFAFKSVQWTDDDFFDKVVQMEQLKEQLRKLREDASRMQLHAQFLDQFGTLSDMLKASLSDEE